MHVWAPICMYCIKVHGERLDALWPCIITHCVVTVQSWQHAVAVANNYRHFRSMCADLMHSVCPVSWWSTEFYHCVIRSSSTLRTAIPYHSFSSCKSSGQMAKDIHCIKHKRSIIHLSSSIFMKAINSRLWARQNICYTLVHSYTIILADYEVRIEQWLEGCSLCLLL